MSIDGAAPPLPVQAEVERGDHLVFARLAGIHVDERAEAVEAQDRETRLGERAEVTARALDPEQVDVGAGHRIACAALRGCVAARVVGVARIASESVRPIEQGGDVGVHSRAPPGLGATDAFGDDALGVPDCAVRADGIGREIHDRHATSARSGRTSV